MHDELNHTTRSQWDHFSNITNGLVLTILKHFSLMYIVLHPGGGPSKPDTGHPGEGSAQTPNPCSLTCNGCICDVFQALHNRENSHASSAGQLYPTSPLPAFLTSSASSLEACQPAGAGLAPHGPPAAGHRVRAAVAPAQGRLPGCVAPGARRAAADCQRQARGRDPPQAYL